MVFRTNIITSREKVQINILEIRKMNDWRELCNTLGKNIDQECQLVEQNSKKKKMGDILRWSDKSQENPL